MEIIKVYHKIRYTYDILKFNMNWVLKGSKPIKNLSRYEYKRYSQNREDGILQAIFKQIGTTNKYFVEIGCGDAEECNTKLLRKQGWKGLLIDGATQKNPEIRKEFVTIENVNHLLSKYKTPKDFDLLSIDINGNDYWILKAIDRKPRVVVIEYNACFQPEESKVIPYKPKFVWNEKRMYCGASLKAINKLAENKGYELIATDNRQVNAFFVKKELIRGNFNIKNKQKMYAPSKYGQLVKEGVWETP